MLPFTAVAVSGANVTASCWLPEGGSENVGFETANGVATPATPLEVDSVTFATPFPEFLMSKVWAAEVEQHYGAEVSEGLRRRRIER